MRASSPLPRAGRRGFTLIEVLLVVAILGIVIGMIGFSGVLRSREAAAHSDVQRVAITLAQAQERYAMRHNRFADSPAALSSVGWAAPSGVSVSIASADAWGFCVEVREGARVASVQSGTSVQSVSCAERSGGTGGTLTGD